MKGRYILLILIFILVSLGFAAKLYPGPLAWWVNDFFGGFLYVVFWCLVGAFLFPRARVFKICAWVFGITCILETLQLWHPSFLEWIRSFFIGRAFIGTTFVWMDFPYYILGSVAGYGILRLIKKDALQKELKPDPSS